MIKIPLRKTMRDVTSSLVGSSFRLIYRDGRVTYSRRIMTLQQLLARNASASSSSTEPRS
jgi:hypothetical protein